VPARWQAIDLDGNGEISQIEFIKALRRDPQLGWGGCVLPRVHEDKRAERAPFALFRLPTGVYPCAWAPVTKTPALCLALVRCSLFLSAETLGLPSKIQQESESRVL